MKLKSNRILCTCLAILLISSLVYGCKSSTSEDKKETEEDVKTEKEEVETKHDLKIEEVTFNPAPMQTDEVDDYIDCQFGPTNDMEVTITILNNGNKDEEDCTVTAILYETDSGDLPAETEENEVTEKEDYIQKIGPGETAQLSFKFTDLEEYAQHHHLGYVIKIDHLEDEKPEDNEYRAYFWLVYGE